MNQRETITQRLSARSERDATGPRGSWSVRDFDPERDADAVSRLDTSYVSDQVYAVHRSGDVDRPYRRRGVGRRLIDDALDRARRSSANHPTITAAHRLGFEICGFDTTRYRGTPHQGEVAVCMAHVIDGDART